MTRVKKTLWQELPYRTETFGRQKNREPIETPQPSKGTMPGGVC